MSKNKKDDHSDRDNKKELSWFKNPQVQVALVAGVLALAGVLIPAILNRPPPLPTNTPIPIPTDTPIPIPTDTPTLTPTNTPTSTSTPSPIDCGNAAIVSGIFAQLAEVNTFSFDGSDNTMFECRGVYDFPSEMSPSVKLEYVDNVGSSAFFSIGFSGSFDVSGYENICVLIYAEAPAQQFDLKLEDANGGQGVLINTTVTDKWKEDCVPLDGYEDSGIDLEHITAITLSFNDAFGSATVWIDNFELR